MRNPTDTYDDADEGVAVHFLWALFVLQALAVAAAVLLPFGFDKRSWLGLDFEHLMLIGAIYILACLLGCAFAATLRKWKLLIVQVGGTLMVLLVLYLISIGLIGNENQPPVSPVEVKEYRAPLEGENSPPDREAVRHTIEEAERQLAEPPIP